jgi:hypothetical protein
MLLHRGNDPNHHTLDTLEQCMAFLLERIAGPDTLDMTSSASQSTLIQRNDTLKRGNMNGIKTQRALLREPHVQFLFAMADATLIYRLPRRPIHQSSLLH